MATVRETPRRADHQLRSRGSVDVPQPRAYDRRLCAPGGVVWANTFVAREVKTHSMTRSAFGARSRWRARVPGEG
jgi:hypothetical protein